MNKIMENCLEKQVKKYTWIKKMFENNTCNI